MSSNVNYCSPEVLFETCVAMNVVDDDDDAYTHCNIITTVPECFTDDNESQWKSMEK